MGRGHECKVEALLSAAHQHLYERCRLLVRHSDRQKDQDESAIENYSSPNKARYGLEGCPDDRGPWLPCTHALVTAAGRRLVSPHPQQLELYTVVLSTGMANA